MGTPEPALPRPLTEAELLNLLAPTGLDWKTPLSAFVARHGVSRPFGWQDVVQLPPSRGISTEPLSWSTPLHGAPLDLPPGHLTAYAWPHPEAARNLEAAEAWLQPALGAGERCDTSNTRGVCWHVGAFTVRATVWPPELQAPSRAPNALHVAEPRLATAATLTLESWLAHLDPDDALLPLTLAADTLDVSSAAGVRDLGEHRLEPHYRYSRRLPAPLRDAWPAARGLAWVLGDRCGLLGQGVALVLPRGGTSLVLERVLPARTPGHARLNARAGADRVTLLRGPATDALDATADMLSRWWGLPIWVEQYEAD